jgi:hypothetical protein
MPRHSCSAELFVQGVPTAAAYFDIGARLGQLRRPSIYGLVLPLAGFNPATRHLTTASKASIRSRQDDVY